MTLTATSINGESVTLFANSIGSLGVSTNPAAPLPTVLSGGVPPFNVGAASIDNVWSVPNSGQPFGFSIGEGLSYVRLHTGQQAFFYAWIYWGSPQLNGPFGGVSQVSFSFGTESPVPEPVSWLPTLTIGVIATRRRSRRA